MSTEKFLNYRGEIKSAAGAGATLAFVTVHPEGQPTGVYRLDCESWALELDPLPAGAVDVLIDGDALWAAGSDGAVYRGSLKGGKLKPLGEPLPAPPVCLAALAADRLAVAAGQDVLVLGRKDGKILQTLALPEPVTCLATDRTGEWLVAGTDKGTVGVYHAEKGEKDKSAALVPFAESAVERIHEGAVTALLFEPEELRFLSVGTDGKLLSTHARGKLEPEDRGRGNNHTEPVAALLWATGDRFLTGSRDSTVKTWARADKTKPATLKDGVAKVVDLTRVTVQEKPQLAIACQDNTIRLFALEPDGRFGDATFIVRDATARAKHELAESEPSRREAALKALAEYADTPSVELLSEQAGRDADHTLRLLAAQLLGASDHPRAAKLLEPLLRHKDGAVSLAALAGLRRHLGETNLRPLELALRTDRAEVGKAAVEALEPLAKKDDQALAKLVEALDAASLQVRMAALVSLEKVYLPDWPRADLTALNSKHADMRRLGLVRLFQGKALKGPRVGASVRRRLEDQDAGVRHAAYLVSLYTRPKLVTALRERDADLARQLDELERPTALTEEELEKRLNMSIAELDLGGRTASVLEAEGLTTVRDVATRPEADLKGIRNFGAAMLKEVKEKLAAQGIVLGAVGVKPAGAVAEPVAKKADLATDDDEPLLQATASRALDVCLHGARGLAVLADPRAFGLLLQLSREEVPSARVEVCRALGALDDARGLKRLRSLLHDGDASVRDAAFSALARLYDADPLQAAEAGLSAGFEDVRRRGLHLLLDQVRKAPPTSADKPAYQLLLRALNDSYPSVRGEAFKATLNAQVAGGGVSTLRFILQSVHADVRLEVLTEVMAQFKEEWAWSLLLEFFNDADANLRDEAFKFAVSKSKELGPLESALASQHMDVRRKGVEGLIKKHTKAAQAVLVRALADREKEIRQLAIDALVDEDARGPLAAALNATHADVRVRAAVALARHGDAKALTPLLTLATAAEPQERERQADWLALAERAVQGLEALGEPAALTDLLPLLDSKHASLRKAAAEALVWVSRPTQLEPLRAALQHQDANVKYRAALGLAIAGDTLGASLVFSDAARQVLRPEEQMTAALCLGSAGEDQLTVFLDHADEAVRRQALLILMMLELRAHGGTPARCLACLSSRMPRVRLTAAQALEVFGDAAAFSDFVVKLFNDRGEEQPWKVTPEVVGAVADLIAFGSPHTRARTALLLRNLSEKEQSAWNQAWQGHKDRYAKEIDGAVKAAPVKVKAEQLHELAFGAYVGLIREQGGAEGGTAPAVVRVRQTALGRVVALSSAGQEFAEAARPVLIQALGDPNQPVRMQAFEHLLATGMDKTALGAEALEVGHTDLGVKGLELLSGGDSAEAGQAALEHVMMSRTDDLATEAAKLLDARRGKIPVAAQALGAAHEALRSQAVAWLAAEYESDPAAKEALRHALTSRYGKVRNRAAMELAGKKDAAAFDALVKLLKGQDDANKQERVIAALEKLGDPRAANAFMDRVEDDPAGTAQVDRLLGAAGGFRKAENADRLLKLMAKEPKWRRACCNAVLAVSGHDQSIDDPEEENPDRTWETKQHPRRDAVLARLLERCVAFGATNLISELLSAARWARGNEVEPILAGLVTHPQEQLRRTVVEALGWRLKKRKGSADPLLKALGHKDPTTQFLAAEGLARGGRAEGLNVLLSAVEFMTDFDLRQRAVVALGELGDNRALDTLLRLAGEDGHALQDVAAEALGHLGKSEKADEVFKLLSRYAKGGGSVASNALRGLRWLNTHAGWQIVRARAADTSNDDRETAVELLGYNDDPATRDLLLKILRTEDEWWVEDAALPAARRLWGADALDPDFALIQNESQVGNYQYEDSLKRVCEKGEATRIFTVFAATPDTTQEELATTLLNRPNLPVAEVETALASHHERTVQLGAELLGRLGAATEDVAQALQVTLEKWLNAWEQRRRETARANVQDDAALARMTPCIERLIWAASRLGVARAVLLRAASARPDDLLYRPIRHRAMEALASGPAAKESAALFETATSDTDPEVRLLAAEGLARQEPQKAVAQAERLLSDAVAFRRVEAAGVDVTAALRGAAKQVHYQGVALPHLIARGDVSALASVVGEKKLPEATRFGAVEALGKLARPDAEDRLAQIGKDEKEDEELRKAAWRALRRSKRARAKATAAP